MREINLNTASAGMTRLRVKGGASPESLYELYNAYINASKIPQQRPGVPYKFSVPVASKGLVLFKGVFYTFTAAPVTAVSGSTNLILPHPTPGFAGTIKQIHFAQPYMGYLYVVAEFTASGSIPAAIYHYWLQLPKPWKPFTVYKDGDLVQPTTPNGFYYRAYTANPPPAWEPTHKYSLNNRVQPTVYNGFQYSATILLPGDPTSSSDTEPVWPTEPNSFVLESSAGGTTSDENPKPPEPPPPVPPGLRDGGGDDSRYKNIGGSGGRGQFGNTPIRVR